LRKGTWPLGILLTVGVLIFDTAAVAQQPVDAIHADDSALTPVSPSPHKRVPVFGGADEFAVAAGIEYYEPEPGFDRQDRDIDIDVAQAAVAAHYREGWEFQFDGLVTRNRGTAVLSSTPPIPPPVTSNSVAIGAGPMARWDFLEINRLRFFIDSQADLILNDRPFPPHGSSYDFLLQAGGGINYRMNGHYRFEGSFRAPIYQMERDSGPRTPPGTGGDSRLEFAVPLTLTTNHCRRQSGSMVKQRRIGHGSAVLKATGRPEPARPLLIKSVSSGYRTAGICQGGWSFNWPA
jgi:hypothetical protein